VSSPCVTLKTVFYSPRSRNRCRTYDQARYGDAGAMRAAIKRGSHPKHKHSVQLANEPFCNRWNRSLARYAVEARIELFYFCECSLITAKTSCDLEPMLGW